MANADKIIKDIIEDNLRDVKNNLKTSSEAFCFVIAFLLAANIFETIDNTKHAKYLKDFKSRLEVLENEEV